MKYLIVPLFLILASCNFRDTNLQIGDAVTNGVCTGLVIEYNNNNSQRDTLRLVRIKCPDFSAERMTDDAENWKRVK